MDLEKLFPKILKPALGCTEPVAVALAAAAAVQAAAGWTPAAPRRAVPGLAEEAVESIQIRINRNIFKNAFAIFIPNAPGHKGILMSAALGVFCDPGLELQLFRDLQPGMIQSAEKLIATGRVTVEIAAVSAETDLYIEAVVRVRQEGRVQEGSCVIRDHHTNIVSLTLDGRPVFQKAAPAPTAHLQDDELETLRLMNLAEIVSLVEDLPPSVQDLIRQTIALNMKACEAGMSQPMGLGAGYHGIGGGAYIDLAHYVSSMAAAGSAARMSGFPLEVMSSAGSGNQGIIATMPVVAWARSQPLPEQRLLAAVALSHLVTMRITLHVGYLSALCGVASKAGIGAACGIAYAMGGGADDIARTVKIMAASLAGMICDGAKPGCALKVSTSADMATRAAQLALKKMEVSEDEGIVAPTAEETIANLAKLSRSMGIVDDEIVSIMNEKLRRC